jgi:hypothetical protein
MSSGSFPVCRRAKPVSLVVLLVLAGILAGCGGGGKPEPSTQIVNGAGYAFAAPAGWTVTRSKGSSAAANGDVDRVEVLTFRLVRPYVASRFRAAARELDSVIARIAAQLDGHVTQRRTIRVAGRKVRSYVIAYDGKTQEITFVLDGRQEHQLLCRRLATGGDEACRSLLSSFTLR